MRRRLESAHSEQQSAVQCRPWTSREWQLSNTVRAGQYCTEMQREWVVVSSACVWRYSGHAHLGGGGGAICTQTSSRPKQKGQQRTSLTTEQMLRSTGDVDSSRQPTNRTGYSSDQSNTYTPQAGGNTDAVHNQRLVLWAHCNLGGTFVLSILSLAPSLSSPWEVPQVDRTRPQTFLARHLA